MTLEAVSFEGHRCVRLRDGGVTVTVTTSVGPRVLGLGRDEGNVMAVLPETGLDRPGGDRFPFIGGHRLWAGPEVPEVTYEPDDRPCEVTEVDDGARIEAPADGAGLTKAISVHPEDGGWRVEHELRNDAGRAMTVAPWAITQLRPGGTATLPLPSRGPGPQADRALVLWPYTELADPRIAFEPGVVRVRSSPSGPALKVGVAPGDGPLSYRIDDEVLEKRVGVDPSAVYADRGAALQVYLCDEFCELETLGPLVTLEPGATVRHTERWTLRAAGAGRSDT
ncbi:MAG TPA: hypothetical protein VLE71_03440 [Actinomycetota bacterium]|nr:hypothetical protein [Actinomycetota bacterium]